MGLFKKLIGVAVGAGLIFAGFLTWNPYLIQAGIGVALLSVSALLTKTPGVAERLQSQTVMVRSAVKPQEILYGEDRKSGVIVYFDTSGDENEFLWFVIAIVEHEIDSYTTLHLDDVAIDIATEIDGSGFVTKADFVDADGNMLVKTTFYTGLDSQTADSDLVTAFSEWTTDHKGEGVAYLIARLELDRSDGGTDPENPEANVWSKGYPRDISVTAKGAKVYDPRLDDENGGTGSHRVDTSSTWEWSPNSALCRADYLRSSRFGPGYTSSEVIWPTIITNADIAEEQVALPGSPETFQDRYTLNGVVNVSDSPKAVLESMQSADHGVTLFLPAGLEILVGAWDASSWTIDKTWIAGAYSYTSAISADDTYNAVRGQYLSKDSDYTLIEFQPKTASAYETEDGGTRVWQDVVLPFTNEEFLAQRLAIIELKKSRQQKVVQLECNFRAELVEPYQVITLDLPGISSQTYRVMGKETTTDGITKLSLRQEVESDWTYTVPDLAIPPVIPTIIRSDDGTPAPTNLAAASGPEGIWLTWTNPGGMAHILHIEVYASADNDRSNAALIASELSESYFHQLADGTDQYYWILSRNKNGLVSTWEPTGATSGVTATAGGAAAGVDAAAVKLTPDQYVIIYDTAGAESDTINFTTAIQSIDVPYYEFFVDDVSKQASSTTSTYTLADGDEPAISGVIAVKVEAREGSGGTVVATDTVSIYAIQDGSDAITAYLDNSAHVVAADSDGTNYSLAGAGGNFKVWISGTDESSNCTYSGDATQNGLTMNVTEATGAYSLSGGSWTSDDEIFTLTVTIPAAVAGTASNVVITADYSISKSIEGDTGPTGDAGLDGLTIEVNPAQFGISADSDGNVVTAGLVNSLTTIKFYEGDTAFNHTGTSPGQGEFRITGRSYSPSGFSGGSKTGTGTDTANFAVIGSWPNTVAIVGYIDYAISYKRLAETGSADTVTIRQPITITRAGGGAGDTVDTLTDQSIVIGGSGNHGAAYKIDNNGKVYKFTGTNNSPSAAQVTTLVETWLPSGGDVANYKVSAVLTDSTGVNPLTGTLNSWQSCSTDRHWYSGTSSAEKDATLEIKIKNTDNVIVASAFIYLGVNIA